MAAMDIYSSVLDYMCENYDYSLYATDFDAKSVSLLQRSIASISTPAGVSRTDAIKTALQDFFNAIFQKVFVYEDEERLKIVKYFDKGALNENQDKQIHALKLDLVKYKAEVELSFKNNSLYMFDKASRNRFEITLLSLVDIPVKDIIREQISAVYDLEQKDIVVFLNGKIFFKRFTKTEKNLIKERNKLEILHDKRFIDDLWMEVKTKLYESFKGEFEFLKYDEKEFYDKYPKKFFSIVKVVVKNSFVKIDEEDIIDYSNMVFKNYLPMMLKEVVDFIFGEILENNLRAIKFLKFYSESTKILNNKMKLKKEPMMNKEGKIYKYQSILAFLKQKELINSKITHKKIELKNFQLRVKKSLLIVQRSEDEMERIQKRRLELLLAIEKVEDEIALNKKKKSKNNLNIDRLEFSKRDLLEAFKQVEIRSQTQTNIMNNTHKELEKWEEKRHAKNILKQELDNKYLDIIKEYRVICEVFAIAISKEPLEL